MAIETYHKTVFTYPKRPYHGQERVDVIDGLKEGTRAVSVTVTENLGTPADSKPHAGDAVLAVHSAQLTKRGRECRVIWSVKWEGAGRDLDAASFHIMGISE